jgi:hypothetical protein
MPIESRLPRTRFESMAAEGGGTVTFITTWLASHSKNSCSACEGLGFCLHCDARGCDDCLGGLCETCKGMGLRLHPAHFPGVG